MDGISLPNAAVHFRQAVLVVRYQPSDVMAPYERLLGDAMQGDLTLFTREDAVEAAWRVVDPVLSNPPPLHEYDQNSWGPSEADADIRPPAGWYNPVAS
jgi:glucose-6-phosphate 1-dehydrogenase